MRKMIGAFCLLLTVAGYAQQEAVLQAFSKYKIDRVAIDSLNVHSYLAYPFSLTTTIVTDASKKEYTADYDPTKPAEDRWLLNTVNGSSPSKADRKTFDKLHSEKIPPLRPDSTTFQVLKDDGKELVVSCRYDPASMIDDNHFMEGALLTLYFNEHGILTHSTGEIAQPFKIKMFRGQSLRSNTTYKYIAADKKYLPLKEEINVQLRILAKPIEMLTVNEYFYK